MRIILSILFLSTMCPCRMQAQPHIFVDERQELSAIVWRLAGAEEYMQPLPQSYEVDIRRSFDAFRDHPLLAFIRTMRDAPDSVNVVSYNSVPTAAVVMEIRQGRVRLNPSLDLTRYLQREDSRWTVANLKRYAKLLDDFYRRSDFDRFFREHTAYYAACVADAERLYEQTVHSDWFECFYGMTFPELSICVSPAFGRHNYALSEGILDAMGRLGVGVLLGVSQDPGTSQPGEVGGVLIHEISHYFTNRIFSQYAEAMLPAGERIFAALPRMLTAAGYGAPGIVCGEFLNELCSMMYRREVLNYNLLSAVRNCRRMGFIWVEEGLNFMDNFTRNRLQYPTFADFMPQLVGFMLEVAANIEETKRIYNEPPFVVSTFPATRSVVPADIREVRIRFSHPMNTGVIALREFGNEDILPLYDDSYYDDHEEDPEYWADDRTLVIRLPAPLQPGRHYGVILPAVLCKNNDIPMQRDYELSFTTRR